MSFAQVTSVSGAVTLTRPGQTAAAVEAAAELLPSDVLCTGPAARVGVDFADGRAIVVGENARVRLVDAGAGYESVVEDELVVYGNTVVARLDRVRGEVRVYRDGEGELPAVDGLELFQGDMVSTGVGGRVRVVALDGSQRVIGGGTCERVGQTRAVRTGAGDVSVSVVESTDADGAQRRDVSVSVPLIDAVVGATAPARG